MYKNLIKLGEPKGRNGFHIMWETTQCQFTNLQPGLQILKNRKMPSIQENNWTATLSHPRNCCLFHPTIIKREMRKYRQIIFSWPRKREPVKTTPFASQMLNLRKWWTKFPHVSRTPRIAIRKRTFSRIINFTLISLKLCCFVCSVCACMNSWSSSSSTFVSLRYSRNYAL